MCVRVCSVRLLSVFVLEFQFRARNLCQAARPTRVWVICVCISVPNGVRRRRARICISGACRAVRIVHTCARRGRSPTADGLMPRVIGPHIDVIIYCLTDRTAARILMGVRGNYAVLAECGKPWTRAHAHVTSISRIRLGPARISVKRSAPVTYSKVGHMRHCMESSDMHNMCNILIKSPAI